MFYVIAKTIFFNDLQCKVGGRIKITRQVRRGGAADLTFTYNLNKLSEYWVYIKKMQ